MHSFKPLLASNAVLEKIKYPALVSTKFDGVRGIVRQNDRITRSLKPIRNKHVQKMLMVASAYLDASELFDGELVVSNSFQESTSGIMSEKGTPLFTYNIFDYLDTEKPNQPFIDRYRVLQALCSPIKADYIKVIPQVLVQNEEELLAFYRKNIGVGEEGIVIRSPEGRYKYGRSTVNEGLLLRMKDLKHSEAIIREVLPQFENTNKGVQDLLGHMKRSSHKENKVEKATLGKFLVEDTTTGVLFAIGTGKGLTHELRKTIWDRQEEYTGKIIRYVYQAHGVKDKPRIPVFDGFRDEEDMS